MRKELKQLLKIAMVPVCTLLAGTSLASDCTSSPDCKALGYTKTSEQCQNNGVKCPFGEAWYCPCNISHAYTCTGLNESPSPAKCGNKYRMCNCATGTHWDTSKCVSSEGDCLIGRIFYDDGTCSVPEAYNSSKIALGVVVYVNPNGVGGQVLAPKPLSGTYEWGGYGADAPVAETTDLDVAKKDYNSCDNTIKLVTDMYNTYPAAEATRRYAPTHSRRVWCLPAAGIISSWYVNRSVINVGMAKLGGTQLGSSEPRIWSSTEYNATYAWDFWTDRGESPDGLNYNFKDYSFEVYLVLEF